MSRNVWGKVFYRVYTGNSKASNTARDVQEGAKQASRVQENRFSLAIHDCFLSAENSERANQIRRFTIHHCKFIQKADKPRGMLAEHSKNS